MLVLIIGAGGLVGRALTQRLSRQLSVVALGRRDLDVTDSAAVRSRVFSERPNLVINCTAVGVDECEAHPDRARAINVAAPEALARGAAEIGAEMLHFSSNYVFDGRRGDGRPYTIEDSPNPINVYGKTKLEGERAVAAACPASYIVRTSWVFGPGKASFLSGVHRKLLAGERVRAITDTRASTTYVGDLAERVTEILERRRHGIYQIVNAGSCTYSEFAMEAARILELAPARAAALVEPVRESDMRRPAPRPASTSMRCLLSEQLGMAPMRPWQGALADYIKSDIAGSESRR